QTAQGRVITLRAPVLPLSGGYRLLLSRGRVSHLLEALHPDRLEVSDRTTLRWTGQWARSHSVPTVMISHEGVTRLLAMLMRAGRRPSSSPFRPGPGERLAQHGAPRASSRPNLACPSSTCQ